NDINREAPRLLSSRQRLNEYVSNQTVLRNLSESVIIDGTGQVLAKSRFAFAITFTTIDDTLIEQARSGDVVQINSPESNKIQALIKLNSFVDAYLLVGRYIDEDVLAAIDRTRIAAEDYQSLSIRQFDLQLSFAVMFSVVAILMVLSSLWLGLNLANSIVNPLVRVISAADEVRAGNWRTRVEENDDVDEISRLGTSFNRMLDELSSSREQLVQANHQLDARREFTEAVLGGVSSGVIGMDRNTKITLPNGAACDILKTSQQSLFGKKLSDAVPEFAVLLKDIHAVGKSKDAVKSQIELSSQGRRIIVLVQITKETVEGRLVGYVLTFDDITDLLSAQRKAAWADVARRIAHEIKNPLTPITLATDRLIKKYMPDDAAEQDRFREYVSIISRQVDDIGRMVDEFSKFARMPSPVFKQLDLYKLVTEHKLLFASSEQQTVKIEIEQIDSPIMLEADAGLMRQMLTNILKNASESMVEAGIGAPLIKIGFDRHTAGAITVRIADTGPGFSGSQLEQYLEPYVTTRDKGTGLGLAIVQKIIMEHKGAIELANHPDGGGMVNITLPLISVETTT
ncbi:MAG: ATP-binding protein, partial [Candidatus Puniceispirillaceae bacterium]